MSEKVLTIEEVAVRVGSSVPTISSWYRWKHRNMENKMAQLLPEFFRVGPHRARCWYESDVEKMIEFKKAIPQGRNGIMGAITQQYVKKNQDSKKYIKDAISLLHKNSVDSEIVDFVRELLEEDYKKRNLE